VDRAALERLRWEMYRAFEDDFQVEKIAEHSTKRFDEETIPMFQNIRTSHACISKA
jgi:hypothetical protein